MSKTYYRLAISKETKVLLDECLIKYYKDHPEMKHVFISQDKLLYEMALYILR